MHAALLYLQRTAASMTVRTSAAVSCSQAAGCQPLRSLGDYMRASDWLPRP